MNLARGAIILTICALAGCGNGDGKLRFFSAAGAGPEEFNVVPTKRLEDPESYDSLPAPTPGSANLVDPNPEADAIAALGGNGAAVQDRGPSASDSALVAYAGRAGVNPEIRPVLAEEDAEFRRRKAQFNWIRPFKLDQYYRAYEEQSLDPRRAAEGYIRRGVPVPSYSPVN